MPVVINDFEVVTPTAHDPGANGAGAPGAGAAGAGGGDQEELLRRVREEHRTRREREERLRAT